MLADLEARAILGEVAVRTALEMAKLNLVRGSAMSEQQFKLDPEVTVRLGPVDTVSKSTAQCARGRRCPG